jgi:hypothetical protein
MVSMITRSLGYFWIKMCVSLNYIYSFGCSKHFQILCQHIPS